MLYMVPGSIPGPRNCQCCAFQAVSRPRSIMIEQLVCSPSPARLVPSATSTFKYPSSERHALQSPSPVQQLTPLAAVPHLLGGGGEASLAASARPPCTSAEPP